MPSSRGDRRPSRKRPRSSASAPPAAARDWAALPQDILFAVFLKIGPREILRGADRVCMAWRRVAIGERLLWRRLDMAMVPLLWWRWRAALRCGTGRWESFEARGCSDASLLYLVKRAPLLKKLRLLDCDATFVVLKEVIKKLPLLEDLEIELSDISTSHYKKLIGSVCEACPHLKKISLRQPESYSDMMDDSDEDAEILDEAMCATPVTMSELQALELTDCDFTVEKLVSIIDKCPILESLHIIGCYERLMIGELREKCRLRNVTFTLSSDEEFYSEDGSEWDSNDESN